MAKHSFELKIEARHDKGKGASRRLRRADKVPLILYGGGQEPSTLAIGHTQLLLALENEAFYSQILNIDIDGKKERAVLRDLQRHPYKPRILHMDLLRITGKEKIQMRVPLHFLGGDVAPGIKAGGQISHILSDVELRCLPDNLPEYIEVDLAQMNIGDSIHLSNLKLPAGVELIALAHKNDLPVANLYVPKIVEELPPVAAVSAAEVPTVEKGKEVKEEDEKEAPEGKTKE